MIRTLVIKKKQISIVLKLFIFNILSATDFKTPWQHYILQHIYYLTFYKRLLLQLKDFNKLTIYFKK